MSLRTGLLGVVISLAYAVTFFFAVWGGSVAATAVFDWLLLR